MIEQVNATRIELTKLKNQLVMAKRGHKLLRDKQDEMIRQILEIAPKYRLTRIGLETDFLKCFTVFNETLSNHSSEEIKEITSLPSASLSIEYNNRNIMGIHVPEIALSDTDINVAYSIIDTHESFDEAVGLLNKSLPKLFELAKIDKTCHLLIKEIEKVKRRVNAIEHFMIPELEAKIKEITTKLADADLSNTIRTMKSKEIVLKKSNQRVN